MLTFKSFLGSEEYPVPGESWKEPKILSMIISSKKIHAKHVVDTYDENSNICTKYDQAYNIKIRVPTLDIDLSVNIRQFLNKFNIVITCRFVQSLNLGSMTLVNEHKSY